MKIFKNYLLVFLSILVTILFCELVYRGYVHINKPLHGPSSFPDLGWDLIPGAKFVEDNIEGAPVTYLINLSGFRDKTNEAWKRWNPENVKIAFVGDSTTYGEGVYYKDSYGSIVESLFYKAGLPVRTINLGISGFNTLQHLAIIKYKALPLEPDIIILGYFVNDTERRRTQTLPGAFRYVLRHFHLGTFLISRVAMALENRRVSISNDQIKKKKNLDITCEGYAKRMISSYETMAWQDNKKVLREMSDLCKTERIIFGIVFFPFESQITGICPDYPQKMISSFCKENSIPFLDMTEKYKDMNDKNVYLQGDNIHLNLQGHYVAAKAISRWLLSEPEFKEIFSNLLNN